MAANEDVLARTSHQRGAGAALDLSGADTHALSHPPRLTAKSASSPSLISDVTCRHGPEVDQADPGVSEIESSSQAPDRRLRVADRIVVSEQVIVQVNRGSAGAFADGHGSRDLAAGRKTSSIEPPRGQKAPRTRSS